MLKISFNKSIFFYSLYALVSAIFIFLLGTPTKGIISVTITVLLWKIVVGMSWLNFSYLLLGYLEMRVLANWFNVWWLIPLLVILLILFFKKIITDNKKSSQFLSYFISTGWILISYGLYFYLNQPFFISLMIYLGGLILISYLNFLNLDKEISINFLIYLLINLEIYCLLSYLSLNGLQFGALILLLQYFLLHFV